MVELPICVSTKTWIDQHSKYSNHQPYSLWPQSKHTLFSFRCWWDFYALWLFDISSTTRTLHTLFIFDTNREEGNTHCWNISSFRCPSNWNIMSWSYTGRGHYLAWTQSPISQIKHLYLRFTWVFPLYREKQINQANQILLKLKYNS